MVKLLLPATWLQQANPVVMLLLRFWLGYQFWLAGAAKVETMALGLSQFPLLIPTSLLPSDTTLTTYRYEYDLPLLPPWLVATTSLWLEMICAILLMLGLFTRTTTAILFAYSALAYLAYGIPVLGDHFPWLLLLMLFFVQGPGRLSLDHLRPFYRRKTI